MSLHIYFSKRPLIFFMSLHRFSFFIPLPETAIYSLGDILSPQCILLQRNYHLLSLCQALYMLLCVTCIYTHFIEEKTEAQRLTSPKDTQLSLSLWLLPTMPHWLLSSLLPSYWPQRRALCLRSLQVRHQPRKQLRKGSSEH